MGVATIGIDAVSHGVGLSALEQTAVAELVKPYGLDPMARAILQGRAIDWDNDGIVDSGSDYFTAYVIHTRDVVRQTAIDEMQLVRVLRSFDGVPCRDASVRRRIGAGGERVGRRHPGLDLRARWAGLLQLRRHR
jgi:hypothetical protein